MQKRHKFIYKGASNLKSQGSDIHRKKLGCFEKLRWMCGRSRRTKKKDPTKKKETGGKKKKIQKERGTFTDPFCNLRFAG